ncbi:hypothetical protein A3F45_02600 [Candidatus Curtissbacteria bacterium RIFCSPHIGHO2_12_FULL_41_17]|uniref:CD-NTase-associated protein 12/Pycsar effector protein TIR domain-containing protein n=2 Tax=Candidatus Curtissiibacteriota TaxID=1752717 RepID=A0A1F5HKF2_9BACT|nr:MAG: hypothetical protein A2693_01525 [Candidatus Curtissbacteria bacterium RIFCSPHIGHO2_01_FULL_40_12]OGE04583.1 MAG: hypothetical protein A3F45_02600 [Candidatus Curtissbacteria bacterium RIFCSPHIGHO2_12_FULL_41_17]
MIYITSTIHHSWNRKFNAKLCEALEKRGIKVYLPQRDTIQDKKIIFKQNHRVISRVKAVLAIAINESPNWGVEIGFSYGIGKKVIALTQARHEIPLMAKSMFSEVLEVKDPNNIKEYIDRLVKIIPQDN